MGGLFAYFIIIIHVNYMPTWLLLVYIMIYAILVVLWLLLVFTTCVIFVVLLVGKSDVFVCMPTGS